MKRLRFGRIVTLVTAIPVMLAAFQNCSPVGSSSKIGASAEFDPQPQSGEDSPQLPNEIGFSPTPSVPPSSNTVYVQKDIKTDFGAVCDGIADDGPAFMTFNAWAKAQSSPVQLNIPKGSVCSFLNHSYWWVKDIKKLLVVGYGATITNKANASGPGFFLGGRGQRQDNLHSARVATVNAGSAMVTLSDKSKLTLFTAGQYALITGFDLQGLWNAPYGYPSNPHFFEFVKIASIDSASGTINFEFPLKNTYKSTWPLYNSGNQFEVDNGGPATLYALDPSWDTEVEYRGLTISQDKFQTYANGRSVTYRDVKFTGQHCGVPTQNITWSAINSDFSSCIMEVDKMIGTVILDHTTIYEIDFQSSSTDLLYIRNSHITNRLTGTPKKADIAKSKINKFWPGAYAYGRSDEVVCTDCEITQLTPTGVNEGGLNNKQTMANGTITAPNTVGSLRWAVPGTNLIFVGTGKVFQVKDVTQDATNTYVQTTATGGFPSGNVSLRVHPAPKFTCVRCSGDPAAVMLSDAAAQGRPLYSYFKQTYTAATGTSAQAPFMLWGDLVSLKLDVTNAYVGAGSLSFRLSQFDNWVTKKPDGSNFTLAPIIDMKAAGLREITPLSVSGVLGNDSGVIAAPVTVAGSSFSGPVFSSASAASLCPGTACPTISVEMVTQQNIVPSGN